MVDIPGVDMTEMWDNLIDEGSLVAAEVITVICKHNTPEALTTSLFLSPVPVSEAIPEGEYALVRVGDRADVE